MVNEEFLIKAGNKFKSIAYTLITSLIVTFLFLYLTTQKPPERGIYYIFLGTLSILWSKVLIDIYKAGHFLIKSCEHQSYSGPQTFNEMLRSHKDESNS